MQKLNRILLSSSATLLMMSTVLSAQPRGGGQGRDDRYRTYGQEPLDRVRADLDRAARNLNYLSPDDMRRFHRVRDGIREFQRDWERGWFDGEALNQTIRGLESLIERGRLHPRDRNILADDAARLRAMRERHERGGGFRR